MDYNNQEFWSMLGDLVSGSEIVLDRPKGSRHPKYPDIIYEVDYGYLKNTTSMDGGGIDIWRGTDEKEMIFRVHNNYEFMKGVFISRLGV